MLKHPKAGGMRTLSIRQPWAALIVAGIKDIENRSWSTSYRGPILIHAGKAKPSPELLLEIEDEHEIKIPRMEFGGIIGTAEIVDCVTHSKSPWFIKGGFGFVLRNAKRIPFIPCRGQLGFFDLSPDEIKTQENGPELDLFSR